MKKIALLAILAILITAVGCTNTAPDSSSSAVPLTAATTSGTTTAPISETVSDIMPPAQGGDMLYPTYFDFPNDEYIDGPAYVSSRIGMINQKGEMVYPPQFDSFQYYKNIVGKIQYIITISNGKITVYNLDGSIYMQIDGIDVTAVDGFPFLVVCLAAFYGGPGSEDSTEYTVYDLRSKQKVLVQTYNDIEFVDSHTAILRNYTIETYQNPDDPYDNPLTTFKDYLYDFNSSLKQKIPFDGGIQDMGIFIPPYVDTADCFPATTSTIVDYDGIYGDSPTIYLGRDGHQLPGEQGTQPYVDAHKNYSDWQCGIEEGTYTWVTEGDKVGYQNNNGDWVYQTSKYGFLED